MSDHEEIRVGISPDGEVSIEVRGVRGEKCLELTQPLEEALAGKIVSRRKTSEYYESAEEASGSEEVSRQELERDG